VRCRSRSRVQHFALQVGQRFPHYPLEEGMVRHLERMQVHANELRVVVEHLLEVGHQPPLVHAVARESAAEMVVHAALGHLPQRVQHHLQRRRPVVLTARASRIRQQELQVRRARKLRRTSEPAPSLVKRLREELNGLLRRIGSDVRLPGYATCRHLQVLRDPLRRSHDLLPFVGPRVVDRLQQPRKPRASMPVGRREVRPRIERPPVRRAEHRHRPPTLARERLHRRHVDAVDVRPLLAVDLHVHEPAVHQHRRCGVLERFVRHDVAPVARAVADRQQYRLVLVPRFRQRLRPPRIPIHRVIGVL
jgi:hypothetical protein